MGRSCPGRAPAGCEQQFTGEKTMSTKTKIALAAFIIAATAASAARAENSRDSGGYQVQSWQEIGARNQSPASNAGSAYGYVGSPTHRASHAGTLGGAGVNGRLPGDGGVDRDR